MHIWNGLVWNHLVAIYVLCESPRNGRTTVAVYVRCFLVVRFVVIIIKWLELRRLPQILLVLVRHTIN